MASGLAISVLLALTSEGLGVSSGQGISAATPHHRDAPFRMAQPAGDPDRATVQIRRPDGTLEPPPDPPRLPSAPRLPQEPPPDPPAKK